VVACQVCNGPLINILSLGYMPPPNEMPQAEGHEPKPQTWLPTDLMFCEKCELAQLGYVPDQTVAFPDDYPYTSGATPALQRNFAKLALDAEQMLDLRHDDLVVDIGSNDGTLLEQFDPQQRRLGIEPTAAAVIAQAKGLATVKGFFSYDLADTLRTKEGQAKLITCANCFAHMPNIHDVIEGIKHLLTDDGVFVSESHYLIDLIDTLQYDTIYAEHLRYYTVRSLTRLLSAHGLRVFRVDRIPTHGGSIRVYAKKAGGDAKDCFELGIFSEADCSEVVRRLHKFAAKVQRNKLAVLRHIEFIKFLGGRVVGIGAPSRGSTVINYLRLDRSIVDYVCEQPHSHKIGRLMPGTDIPVVDEARLYADQPAAAILFSWHLADELIPKIRAKGYHGEIISPCSATITEDSPVVVAAA
jgi:SAM-dependent methyltransferase